MADKSVFETLNAINCNEHTERKNGLTYLSWAWAWATVKKNYPTASYTIYENSMGLLYHTDGKTAWVKTGVTIEGMEHIEYLPVMDSRNKSIPVAAITSFDVNKAVQRSLTKACARHGLGLYIYAGEDLPDSADHGSAQDDQLAIAMDELNACKVRADLASWDKTWLPIYGKDGATPNIAIRKRRGERDDEIIQII